MWLDWHAHEYLRNPSMIHDEDPDFESEVENFMVSPPDDFEDVP